MSDLADAAAALRSLHRPGSPLVLPNAWDIPSALVIEQAGFPVVGTSSAAMLEAIGHHDGGNAPVDDVFAAIARIAKAVTVPVTADLEDGYGLPPVEIVDRLLDAGAVGCNLEDSDHRHPGCLVDAKAQAERIEAVRAAGRARGVDLVVNARIDTWVRQVGDPHNRLEETQRRAALYSSAGADCVFPILIPETQIGAFMASWQGGLNVLAPPDRQTVLRLASFGVARISMGPHLSSAVRQFLADLLSEIAPPSLRRHGPDSYSAAHKRPRGLEITLRPGSSRGK